MHIFIKKPKKCKIVIFKFISFRYCTRVYRQNKNLHDGAFVHVDQIKKWHLLLKKTIDLEIKIYRFLFQDAKPIIRIKM